LLRLALTTNQQLCTPTISIPAAIATKNSGAEAAAEWVFAHMGDADFDTPLPEPGAAAAAATAGAAGAVVLVMNSYSQTSCKSKTLLSFSSCNPQLDNNTANPEAVASLTAMGFSADAAEVALGACSGSLERAADWLFSHMDDLESAVAAAKAAANGASGGAGGAASAGASSSAPADK
jgi:ubiquitin carboxyl-terminal hydrolase 5/13